MIITMNLILPFSLCLDVFYLIGIEDATNFCFNFIPFQNWLCEDKIPSFNPNIFTEFCWHGNEECLSISIFNFMQIVSPTAENL